MFEKNVLTITCHHVYNLGASLQAYALVQWLNDQGCRAKIIDYRPEYLNRHYSLTAVGNPRFRAFPLSWLYIGLKFPKRLAARLGRRKKNFDNFTTEYLPLTDKCYHSYEQLYRDCPDADVYLAGSDQIWNTILKNGHDPAFYLAFAPKRRVRASYAASFGSDAVAVEARDNVERWIRALDYVSVREKQGVQLLEQMGIFTGVNVVDPVFLLSRKQWEKLCTNPNIQERYLLLYDFDNNTQMHQMIRSLADQRELKVVSIFPCKLADVVQKDVGPLEFLTLIANADFVISNSFHATAFSLIFHRQFAVFSRGENLNQRMVDLVSMVGLEHRIVSEICQLLCLATIDYSAIQPLLDQQIQKSKAYLNQVLDKADQHD